MLVTGGLRCGFCALRLDSFFNPLRFYFPESDVFCSTTNEERVLVSETPVRSKAVGLLALLDPLLFRGGFRFARNGCERGGAMRALW